ncbi:MAG: MotE family protein [Nitrospinota bacterium]
MGPVRRGAMILLALWLLFPPLAHGEKKEVPPSSEAKEPKKVALKEATPFDMELLKALEEKRKALESRAREVEREEERLNALRRDISLRLKELRELEERLEKLLAQGKEAQNRQLTHLVKAYEAMRPEEAAPLINKLDERLVVRIFSRMQNKKVGKILVYVDPPKAARISQALARSK